MKQLIGKIQENMLVMNHLEFPFQKLLSKPSKLSDKNTYRLSVVSEIKIKVILIANQKKEKYPLRANENSKSIHLKHSLQSLSSFTCKEELLTS